MGALLMTYEDTEEGVRDMFAGITDLPNVARVERMRKGVWRVYFGDGSEATAYPRTARFEEDPDTMPPKRPFEAW
jgi:hypothetical protein